MRLRIIHVRSDGGPDLPIRRSLGDATVESIPVAKFVRHVEHDGAAVFVIDVDLRSPESVLAVRAGLARSRNVPTVFVTGRGQRAEETQAQALGADGMVTRPIDAVTLELAIRAVLPRALPRCLPVARKKRAPVMMPLASRSSFRATSRKASAKGTR